MLLQIQFLYPEFLYGLAALAIPIILHLFSLKRYKKVYFSNFNFLEALQQQKKNRSRLQHLLLLLLRLFALSCIVIAFATPYTNPEHRKTIHTGKNQVIIYADNSFSMSNTGSQGTLFEEAKKHLLDIVNTYPNGAQFRLLTNEPITNILFSKDEMYHALSQLKITSHTKPLSQVFKESLELKKENPASLFIISDFQKQNCDFPNIPADSTLETVLLVVKPENLNNVYISAVNFEQASHRKNQNEKIQISIVNASNQEYHNLPLSLTINGKKKSINQISILANSEKELEISYLNTGDTFYKGIVEITDFPVLFDNKLFFSYSVNDKAEVLYLWQNQENTYFEKLFSDSITFNFSSQSIKQLTKQNLSPYNLVVLDNITSSTNGLESILEEYVIGGGNLFVLPGTPLTENQNRLLKKIQAPLWGSKDTNTVITHIETQAALFRDVFEQEDKNAVLPHIQNFYPLNSTAGAEKLLSDKRKNTLLAAKTFGKGNIYVSAFNFSPENSNMVFHPLFVPLMSNMAIQINSALNTFYFLNTDQAVTINDKNYQENQDIQIRKDDLSFEFIPEIRKDFSGDLLLSNSANITEVGSYDVVQADKIIDVLAWNYNRSESQMEFSNEEELKKQLPKARVEDIKTTRLDHNSELLKEIVHQDNNKYLTVWFLILAILALLFEQFVWRRKLN